MSSRFKERGGGGGKIMASKPHKVLAESTPEEKGKAARRTPIAAGKENPRTLSCGKISAGRPSLVPKLVEKPGAAAAGVRWSTSSMPRGKAPTPSDFPRLIADLRDDRRVSRVSGSDRMGRALGRGLEAEAGGKRSAGEIRVLEKCQKGTGVPDSNSKGKDEKSVCGVRVLENRKSSGFLGLQIVRNNSRISDANSGKNSGKAASFATDSEVRNEKDDVGSQLNPVDLKGRNGVRSTEDQKDGSHLAALKQSELDGNRSVAIEIRKDKVAASCSDPMDGKTLGGLGSLDVPEDESFSAYNGIVPGGAGKDVGADVMVNHKKKDCLVLGVEKGENNGRVCLDQNGEVVEKSSDNIKVFEKTTADAKVVHVINKYPSKLHEKLALLEGRVQKIASEIKRTKEMLDVNNPDDSKLILSDIQNKISGIEKAVGHVMDGTKGQLDPSEIIKGDSLQNQNAVTSQSRNSDDPKRSVKGLNHEELEARFFPHHKLLRSRRPSGSSGEQELLKNGGDREMQEGALSPVEENPIALEFLASLNAEQSGLDKDRIMPDAVQGMGMEGTSTEQCASKKAIGGYQKKEIELLANEKLEDFDDQENKPPMMVHEEIEEACSDQLCEIGRKPSTGGWFVSEGEAVLLAHDDGSCSYYDIVNYEVKAEYKPPAGVSNNLWGDCWLIRAPGADGCSGRYVVAASAGNTLDSGFCSWDFYTRDIKAFRVEDEAPTSFATSSSSRMVLGPLSNIGLFRRSVSCAMPTVERQQWWYRPCGPLIISCASRQKAVAAYDIRDGDLVMKWEVNSPVMGMEYSSPLQWRSRGKAVIAGTDAISLWDVNSLNPQPLLSVASAGKKVYSIHINNTDAELGGGVRQRVSSAEVEGNDGVFCTQENINVFDFRLPSGIGLKISRHGAMGHSIFSRGDSIFIGSTEGRLPTKGGPRTRVQHYSLRKGKLVATYELPESNSHIHHTSITQVWGNTNLVMGVCGMGLFVFDAFKDEGSQAFSMDQGSTGVKEIIGPEDLYCPTFDYLGSRVLVISRDRPAFWRYLL